ncbi:MAG: penicillin acylase family protein [Planctomycetota bacterium]
MKLPLKLKFALKLRSALPFLWRFAKALMTGKVRRGLFAPEGEMEIAEGLRTQVSILRDQLGVPYVHASTWPDAAFAIGFCHGCDRLGQLELMRRVALGRLSEVVGALALPLDIAVRIIGFPRLAEAYARRIDSETGDLLRAYADGVNAAIRHRLEARCLPIEYLVFNFEPRPWTLTDSLAISRAGCSDINLANKPLLALVARQAGESLRQLILPFMETPHDSATEAPSATEQASWGSNAWAVAGTRTSDGMPVVAADPHVGTQAPCLWYAAAVKIEQARESLAGLTVPGWPFFVLGRNNRVAWGATNMLAETADLFWEKLDGDNYIVDGRHRPLSLQQESIDVRCLGKATIRIRRTHRGVIISDSALLRKLIGAGPGQHVSLAWPAENVPSDELRALYRVNRAGTVAEFADALRSYALCALNFIAADADGHIGQFPAVALPVRKTPPQGRIYDGTTSRCDWADVAFPSPMPACVDPPEGFVANSNDLPSPGGDAETIGPLTCPAYRGNRLRSMLGEAQNLSPRRAAKIQSDCFCQFTSDLIEALVPVVEEPKTEPARGAYELLRDFSGQMAAESSAAAVAGVYSEFFRLRLFGLLLGEKIGNRFAGNYHSFPATLRLLKAASGKNAAISSEKIVRIAAAAFDETVKYLIKHHGRRPGRWQWGKIVKIYPVALLGRVPLLGRKFKVTPCGGQGSSHSVSQLRFRFDPTRKSHSAYLGVTARLVMPLGRDFILCCLHTGQNENPRSSHFQDQFGLLLSGRYGRISLAKLPEEQIESFLVLRPAKAASG